MEKIQENTPHTPGGGGVYSTLTWLRMSSRKFRPPPITRPEKTQICNLCLNHLFLEGSVLKPITTFYHVNWDA